MSNTDDMMDFPTIVAIVCAGAIIISMLLNINYRIMVGLSIAFLEVAAISFALGKSLAAERIAIIVFYLLISGLLLYIIRQVTGKWSLFSKPLVEPESPTLAESVVDKGLHDREQAPELSRLERDKIVLDASAIITWFVDKEVRRQGLTIKELLNKEKPIFVPDLLLYDVASELRNRTGFTQDEIASVVKSISSIGLHFINITPVLVEIALKVMTEHGVSLNQAIYVALASVLEADFITADTELYQRVKKIGFVTLLGSSGKS